MLIIGSVIHEIAYIWPHHLSLRQWDLFWKLFLAIVDIFTAGQPVHFDKEVPLQIIMIDSCQKCVWAQLFIPVCRSRNMLHIYLFFIKLSTIATPQVWTLVGNNSSTDWTAWLIGTFSESSDSPEQIGIYIWVEYYKIQVILCNLNVDRMPYAPSMTMNILSDWCSIYYQRISTQLRLIRNS